MELRLAKMDDLPQLKTVYGRIIDNMNKANICIWDDVYPCEFFAEDIENSRLYILNDSNEIAAAFALCSSNTGADCVGWKNKDEKALYIDRLGVNVEYLRKGIGSIMINWAASLAKEKGAKYLRLFVVDINEPAIKLYLKNGFIKADGVFEEEIDDKFVLREYGFEMKL